MTETLIRITSSYFCAGVVLKENMIWYAASILRYMIYWNEERVLSYAKKKGWGVERINVP